MLAYPCRVLSEINHRHGLLPWVVSIGFVVGREAAQRHFRSLPNPSSHSAFAAWAGAHLLVCALFLAHASWRLHRNFRSLAAPSAGAAWWKRWLRLRR